ncbi:TetR/AcrR family transcriptional regulator [Paenibacillus lignilyticus]|uniref:TetR/AcrR family transcriptional regulator n=1 Tax=Paenibacillus lignilyticus TaxID=1172615 RepID=A0ABS5C772_9BACL|nr:TetR/AcrR family transcriptional regulator [Paenibacillus lignilyticus]MBP3961839.1 TetR/AcrR family transcriptional regulator [Paenibacillus lignilyticus]MBP3963490.1 TetR/AcrR family transcriptional regulator [Paenibacillus lignilyticus]
MKEKETSRYLKGKATKKKIFAVAKELILSKGYSNVTVDEICEKCSLSKGAFYIHYKSKEDIVKKLYRDDFSEYMEEHFGKYINENEEASPVEKLKTFMMVALGFPIIVGEELTKLTFVVNLSQNSTEPSFFSDCIEQELLIKAIADGISTSIFKTALSVDEVVNYIYSFLTGAFITWCLSDADYDIGQASEKYVDTLIKGLL